MSTRRNWLKKSQELKIDLDNAPEEKLVDIVALKMKKLKYEFLKAYSISKSKMISRRLGGRDETYYTYVEETDNDANKNSALI